MDQEDIDWINTEQIFKEEGGRMEPSYNKVQYSEFTPNNGQWVFRGETVEEVEALRKQVFGIVAKPAPQAAVVPPAPQSNSDGLTSTCKKCGAPAVWREGFAKATGKPWKGWFCSVNREHEPFFIK